MITPLDIQNKEFAKGVRGYKEEDVDSFLDLLTVDLEKLLGENATLREEINRINADLERYKNSEVAVVETLEAAKALMRDISVSSEKRAEILLKNAELDAELITREAKESVERLTEESLSLRNRFVTFKSRYKNLLESEIERFDTLSSEIFGDFGDFAMKTEVTKPTDAPTQTHKPEATIIEKRAKLIIEPESETEDLKKTMVNFRMGDGIL